MAIALLIMRGKLPVPECAVIADTGRETEETWWYMATMVAPKMERMGCTIHVASHALSTVDLYGLNGDLLLPMFVEGGGKMPTLCSNEWKKRVVRRWLRQRGYGPEKPVRVWLGMSVDELMRAGTSDVDWASNHYPLLLDVPMRRDECRRMIVDAGWPEPPRSACWMCPHRRNDEWAALSPAEFAQAVDLDKQLRVKHPGTFLHRSMKPLDEVDLTPPDNSLPLFNDTGACDSGYCFV